MSNLYTVPWNRTRFARSLLAAATGLLLAGGAAQAATMFALENHPANPPEVGGGYGLLIDDSSGLNTFDFENDGAQVLFTIDGADSATISGTLKHNQSGQLWSLNAYLEGVVTTNKDDGGTEPWYDPTRPNQLYDGIIEDLLLNGDSVLGDGGANLKNLAFEADRLAFRVDNVTLEFLGDPADAAWDPDGDGDGIYELVGYPGGLPDMVPMVVAKGHGLPSGEIAGLGWLTEPGQAPEGVRDFSFAFGAPVPEPSSATLFAVGSLLCAAGIRRRA